MEADGRSYPIPGGVKCRLYRSFPWLYLQTDKPGTEFVAAPDWYYGFEYPKEIERGYDGYEDLLTTGYFETELEKGESIIFSASLDQMASPETIDEIFADSLARRTHKIDFISCLRHSARQFMIRREGGAEVVADYPWEGSDPRQTLVALPGIALEQGRTEECMQVLDRIAEDLRSGTDRIRRQADTPLWFFWTLQQLEMHVGAEEVWKRYGGTMKGALESYRDGGMGRCILMHDNGLVWAAAENVPLTWMDSVIDGRAVTPRSGYAVEVNALWYNAVCYTLELARKFGDEGFTAAWDSLPEKTRTAFAERFRIAGESHPADYANETETNAFIRPNMVVACGLRYTMLDEAQRIEVLRTVEQHLLTPKGLRSLSPRNPLYKGRCEGSPGERDFAGKNGSVWIWPLVFYVAARFGIEGDGFLTAAGELLSHFEEDIQSDGIGSLSELYDADPPYTARGAVSAAWSVGGVLAIHDMIRRRREAGRGEAADAGAATATRLAADAVSSARKSRK